MRHSILGLFLAFFLPAAAPAQDGFSRYYVAFLYKGPQFAAQPSDSPERKALHEQHVAFIDAMLAEGKMVTYGPFLEAGDLRGMYIFKASSIEEAREWANREPSVKTGMIVMRVYAWLGPPSLSKPIK